MKILHVIANLAPSLGGPVKACLEMARAVGQRGHEVLIYSTDWDTSGRLAVPIDRMVRRDGAGIRYFPVQFPRLWPISWQLARALKEAIPTVDLVHLHSLYLFHDWVTGAVCRRHGVPYLVRPHGTLDPYIYRRHRLAKTVLEHAFQNRVLSRAAAIHYTTEEEKRLATPYA
ncbi:MAG: glycosyltransferase, partial [Proteobacteria bacterium]|nr:glycosyltransferase [Pseudomonadota bacterium]